MLFSHVFAYLLAFIYLHGIHRQVFLLEEVFSVRYELNICHFILQRINVWIHKGHDKDFPQRKDPGQTRTDPFTRQRRCHGTTRTVPFLTLVMNVHEPQQGTVHQDILLD
jgi:hypothetical protein